MWLKETKQVMMRCVQLLASRKLEAGWLAGLFNGYVARADALLASQAGEAEHQVSVSLGPVREKLAKSAQLFNRYWMNDVNPLLQRGFIPPVTEGFERVLCKPSAAVEVPATGAAILLLRSPWQIEHRIASALGQTRGISIEQVSWELVPWRVILPSWEEEVEPHAALLSGIHVSDVAQFAEHRLLELGRKLSTNPRALPGPERLKWKAARTLAVALALTLRRAGWQLAYDGAGDTWEFRSGLRSLDPFGTLDLLASKRMRPEEWVQLCTELGIANLPLATA